MKLCFNRRIHRASTSPQSARIVLLSLILSTGILMGASVTAYGQTAHISIDGKMIMDHQLPYSAQQKLFEIDHSVYQVKLNVYHDHLFQEHVKTLAAQQKKSIEQITSQLLKVKDPTDAELKAFYDEHVNSKDYPFDAIKSHLKSNVIEQKQNEIKKDIVAKLEKQQNFKYLISKPKAPVAEIALPGAAVKGAEQAKITLVKFSDFYCGMCRSMSEILKKILAEKAYKTTVELVYAPFPVFGPKATTLSTQSYCVNKQGQFWQFHDQIFALESSELSPTKAEAIIKELKLDQKAFDTCVKSSAATEFVANSRALGVDLGVSGTPSLFVNGMKVASPTEAALKEALNQAIAALK